MKITAVIVTYNRKKLLEECLITLSHQSMPLDTIWVIDNASTDGTIETLQHNGWLEQPKIQLIALKENTGGAGGFSAGMQYAFEQGADYVWMMDDDAVPHPTALEEIMQHATPEHIYGSLAVNGEDTAWATTFLAENKIVHLKKQVPELAEVQSLPFLGFLTSKEIYQNIGLPDASYFIAADDAEYCMRAQHAGHKIFICGKSQIEHPRSDRYESNILGKKITYLNLVPWKRYYDTRNRILIAKKYYGFKLYTQTIPSLILRLLIALRSEKKRLKQLKAFFAGFYDGVFSKAGKRHDQWDL
ncbi:glycosyltransferase [Acinetobacter sp. ANC 4635]|uniref:glycosyltransferase family 2 protein n=1 Tax=Acinetobacter sp. ANC 4635 TaxID=2529846 RepID=UPI0010396FC0|nr:glycosyltransferase family 2 protein [Acinetobacter sp. ANC 4635]TCB33501.1 glycosyltransferase [Acinetobacter sp. ANC 4635]